MSLHPVLAPIPLELPKVWYNGRLGVVGWRVLSNSMPPDVWTRAMLSPIHVYPLGSK